MLVLVSYKLPDVANRDLTCDVHLSAATATIEPSRAEHGPEDQDDEETEQS